MRLSASQFDPSVRFNDLVALTRPRSVMIVGASNTPDTLSHTTVVNVLDHSDFDGEVYFVNPKGGELQGKRMLNLFLVSATDHGLTPSALSARLTLHGAPEAMQGAIVLDMGLTPELGKALTMIGRSVGLMANIIEEQQNPIAQKVWDMASGNSTHM